MLCAKCGQELNTDVCSHCGYDHTAEEQQRPRPIFEIEDGVLVKYNGTAARVDVPMGVIGIGERAFAGNQRLMSVGLPPSVLAIGRMAFADCPILETVNMKIPALEFIGAGAFMNCTSLWLVPLPDKLQEIEDLTFYGCSALETIMIPGGVKSIGAMAFAECSSLRSCLVRNGLLERIDTGAFLGCTSLMGFYHNGVTRVEELAFSGCTAMKQVRLGNGLQHLGHRAFADCTALTDLTLGPTPQLNMGADVFEGCDGLKAACYLKRGDDGTTVEELLHPLKLRVVREHKQTDEGFDILDGLLLNVPNVPHVTIPEGVTDIAQGVFAQKDRILSVSVPGTVKRISMLTFSDCRQLAAVRLAEGVEEIAMFAFKGCEKLFTIVVPDTVSRVSEWPVVGCGEALAVQCSSAWAQAHPDFLENLTSPVYEEE